MTAEPTTIWGDAMETDARKIDDTTFGQTKETRKPTFADKIKGFKPQQDISFRAVKFYTPKTMQGPELIKHFINVTRDKECLTTMQPTHVFGQKLFWHAVLSKAAHVDTICDKMMLFPSMPTEGIQIMPIRKRAILLTIPWIRTDITNEEIESQSCHFGTVQRMWSQTWKEFPTIANGNRLVTFLPSGGKEIPPFIVCRGQKLIVSYRGRQAICMRCNAQDHLTTECPKKNLKLCHLCASEQHQYRDCPDRETEKETDANSNKENEEPEKVTEKEKETNEEAAAETTPTCERIESSEDESDSETVTGEDLVIDESQICNTPEKNEESITCLPQLHEMRAELVKSSAKRTRQETPPKDKQENASPKPKRNPRKKKAQQSLENYFNQTET